MQNYIQELNRQLAFERDVNASLRQLRAIDKERLAMLESHLEQLQRRPVTLDLDLTTGADTLARAVREVAGTDFGELQSI